MAVCRLPPPRSCSTLLLLLALLSGCRAGERPRPPSHAAALPEPADSLVATSDNGLEVWFTLTRVGKATDGTSCVERGIEIRRGDTRVPVPLLYTGVAPVFVDESTMRAELWNHCRPVDTYLVDLRSGRPVRERSGSTW